MPNTTTNFGLLQPLVNNPTDQDLWGGQLNTNFGNLDSFLLTTLNWTGSSQTSTITVTIPTAGSTTTGSAKTLYLCNATSGAFAANLPAVATAAGLTVAFKKTDSSANAITITGHSSDTIDGSNTFSLSAQYAYLVIQCDGAKWNIISKTAPAVNQFSTSSGGIVPASPAGTGSFINSGGNWLGANIFQQVYSSPTGTNSGPGVMLGLAATITPASTGDVLITLSASQANSGGTGATIQLYYGTGSAPSNGAALTGTSTGNKPVVTGTGCAANSIVTGLTVGTAYWFDLALAAIGGTTSLTQVSLSIFEIK